MESEINPKKTPAPESSCFARKGLLKAYWTKPCCCFFFFLHCFRQVDLSLSFPHSPSFSLFEFIGNLASFDLVLISQVFVQNLPGFFNSIAKMFLTRWSTAFSSLRCHFHSLFIFVLFPLFDFAVSHFVVLFWVFSGPSTIGVSIPSHLKVDCSRLSTRLRLLR